MRPWVCILCALSALASSNIALQAEERYLTHAVISHAGPAVHLAANDPRPLAQALDALQREYGWQVNYEDPQYISRADLVEITNPSLARNSVSPSHVHYPSGGAFDLELTTTQAADTRLDQAATLRLLVDAYNRSSNPGRFDLRQNTEGKFDLVGTAANDPAGHMAQQKPILDFPITLPAHHGAASEIIAMILAQVTRQTHIKVSLGVSPLSLQRTIVNVSGKRAPARTLLSQTLASTGRRFFWRLLFDPDSKTYFLRCMLAHQA